MAVPPSQVAQAVGEIAEIHGQAAEQTAKVILQNLKRLVTA